MKERSREQIAHVIIKTIKKYTIYSASNVLP